MFPYRVSFIPDFKSNNMSLSFLKDAVPHILSWLLSSLCPKLTTWIIVQNNPLFTVDTVYSLILGLTRWLALASGMLANVLQIEVLNVSVWCSLPPVLLPVIHENMGKRLEAKPQPWSAKSQSTCNTMTEQDTRCWGCLLCSIIIAIEDRYFQFPISSFCIFTFPDSSSPCMSLCLLG